MFIFFIAFFINFQILLFSSTAPKTYTIEKLIKCESNYFTEDGRGGIEEFKKLCGENSVNFLLKNHIETLTKEHIECICNSGATLLPLSPQFITSLNIEQTKWLTRGTIRKLELRALLCLSEDQIKALQLKGSEHNFSCDQREVIIQYYNEEENQNKFLKNNQPMEHRQNLLNNTWNGDAEGKEFSTFHFGPRDNKIAYLCLVSFGLTYLRKIQESPLFHNSDNKLPITRGIIASVFLLRCFFRYKKTQKLNHYKGTYFKPAEKHLSKKGS